MMKEALVDRMMKTFLPSLNCIAMLLLPSLNHVLINLELDKSDRMHASKTVLLASE